MVINSNLNTISTQNIKTNNSDYAKDLVKNLEEKDGAFIELSADAHKFLQKGIAQENDIAKNVDYAKESANFDKSNIVNYAGSLLMSQANANENKVANLTA